MKIRNFDTDIERPVKIDHHLCVDSPMLFFLFSSTAEPHSVLCPSSQAQDEGKLQLRSLSSAEPVEYLILRSPRYDSARSVLFITVGFKPSDND